MNVSASIRALTAGCTTIVLLALLFRRWPYLSNGTTVALSFLIVVLLVAATARLSAAVATSIVAMVAFNYFFLPPLGRLTIADPQNWIALIAFLAVSLVASHLSALASERTKEAMTRRDELSRLFDLSRDVLLITDSEAANASLAAFISRRFDLDYVAICLPRGPEWIVSESGSRGDTLNPRDLTAAFEIATAFSGSGAGSDQPGEPAGRAAPHATGHLTLAIGADQVPGVPLRLGTKPIGLLIAAGRPIESGTLDALAGLAAIAIERTQFLEDRKSADLARQGEQLKSALLASLGHDLRTPLTAIRVAADNVRSSWADEQERREQSEIIVTEVDRLTRLFHNILEMARIDAGAVTHDARWVAPSEIVDAARSRVEHALRGHPVDLAVESDRLVRLDPRLAAAALSHLLENAAQYTPDLARIHVGAMVTDEGLTITVRDHGPGIAPGDLPHVFDRFYRGAGAHARRPGTGMGLAIARGILAVEGGRISVENCDDGGARFTISVPAQVK
jgi:two-component system sensor histidine kinase KdpD